MKWELFAAFRKVPFTLGISFCRTLTVASGWSLRSRQSIWSDNGLAILIMEPDEETSSSTAHVTCSIGHWYQFAVLPA
ncbi:hypothetical protein BV898_07815 [Hypsibius exemplaris]|uniref:Uncharacterized protein n=1 Tax=Hypsibius exemplaris TaxID=2072580 RepID=A0A1W0WSQ4_HYPEX|nr:hypothetical protein BV898_07815 [Hypsibius exemplaris]